MRFGVLGTIEAFDKRRRLTTGGPKQRTVLALLIAQAGQPVSTDALITGVYGEDAPSGARRSIQTYVSNLRSELGDAIEASGSGYRLRAERSEIDAFVFEDTVIEVANGADPEVKATRLREALALWRGHPYADVDGMATLTTEIGRLNELRATAIEERVQADLDLGHHRDLIAELDSLTEEYPLRERFRAQQMLALYRSGRQAEALRAYERTRNYLVEEMGLDPSRELRHLEQRILEQDPSLAFDSGPRVRQAAILVAEVADPRMLSTLEPMDRESLIQQQSEALDAATREAGGDVFAHRGSAMYASFASVDEAVAAAVEAQQALAGIRHPMRMGVSVGEVQIPVDGALQGPPLTRAAQLVAVGHGGQVLLSPEANQALVDSGEAGWIVRSLGHHDVDGSGEQRPVYQLVIDGLPRDFPPLRSEILPPPLPIDVRGLPGYELREQVGSGAFGVVHRGYQPSVGREVAVKIIRPEYANDPDFIRHFEVEAQLVARLEHPHIVPLHDYWRSPEGAYLVMRWLRGGTLHDRIATGPLSVSQADALIDQIAPALAFAHRHGVVHRDLKPSNILLDEDGAPYLSDFGIARLDAATDPGSVAADVRDLAGVVALALHGTTSNHDIGRLLSDATGDESPYLDVGSFVEAWNRAIGDQPDADHATTYTETRNPYKGLQAFGELDADDFYGRDAEIAEIIDTLRTRRFVAVVGPSGIGKSSVTRAGAIPALRNGAIDGSEDWLITDMMPGPYPFEELTAALMRVSVEPPRQMEEELGGSDRGLVRYVRHYLPEGSTLLLVIDQFEELFTLSTESERTEFLAMLAATAADERSNIRIVITMRADFFDRPLRFAELGDALREGTIPIAAADRESVIAMITRPAEGVGVTIESGLPERIAAEVKDQPGALPLLQYTLAELFENRTSDTITNGDYDSTGGVLGTLASRAEDVYTNLDQDGQQAARQLLLRLVRVSESGRVTRRRVTLADLDLLPAGETHVRGAIRAFAEPRLLTYDTDDTTRMPTIEVAHEALLREWPRLTGWIDDLHEDLILHARLTTAVNDWESSNRDDNYLLTGGRLTQHENWTEHTDLTLTRDETELLTASRTAEDTKRSKRRRTRNFVTAGFGLAAIIGLVLAVLAMGARNDAEEQARKADEQALLASSKSIEAEENAALAEANASQAATSASLAKARELAASAINVVVTDPELATLLALESLETASSDTGLFPEAMLSLRQAMDANRLTARLDATFAKAVAFTPDGSGLLVVDTGERSVSRYAIDDGSVSSEPVWVHTDEGTTDAMSRIAINPAGTTAAILILNEYYGGSEDGRDSADDGRPGRILMLDVVSGAVIDEFHPTCRQAEWGPFYWTSDGSMLGVKARALPCAEDPEWTGSLLVDPGSGEVEFAWKQATVTMTEDMSTVLVDRPYEAAELRAFPSDELLGSYAIPVGAGGRVISPDGSVIVYRPENNLDIRPGFWDVETNQKAAWGDGFTGFYNIGGTAFAPTGAVLTASTESDVLYDPQTGLALLSLPTKLTHGSAISPDGAYAATANSDMVQVWRIGGDESGTSLLDSDAELFWLNSDMIDEGEHVGLWGFVPQTPDVYTWRYAVLDTPNGTVESYIDSADIGAQLPDGRVALLQLDPREPGDELDDAVGPLVVWDPETGDTVTVHDCAVTFDQVFAVPNDGPWWEGDLRGTVCPDGDFFFGFSIVSSDDGRFLAAVGHDPASAPENPRDRNRKVLVRVWDLSTMEPVATHPLELDIGFGNRLLTHFADDWLLLLDGFPGTDGANIWKILDVDSGEVRAQMADEVPWRESVAISGVHQRMYAITEAGTVVEYDTASWMALRRWEATQGRPRGLSLSPDATLLAVGGEDELVAVWDLSTTDPVLIDRVPIGAWASDTVWLSDTAIGVVAMNPGSSLDWKVIDIAPASVINAARLSLLRGFTADECALYNVDACR